MSLEQKVVVSMRLLSGEGLHLGISTLALCCWHLESDYSVTGAALCIIGLLGSIPDLYPQRPVALIPYPQMWQPRKRWAKSPWLRGTSLHLQKILQSVVVGFGSLLYHLWALCPWYIYVISSGLSFLIYKMGITSVVGWVCFCWNKLVNRKCLA